MVGYNCDFCIAKEYIGARRGRLCFSYQLDLDEDYLKYSCKTKDEEVGGIVKSIDEFYYAVNEILTLYKTNRIEVALKQFTLNESNVSGVCPKSFPKTKLTSGLLSILNLTIGGQSGTELMQLPYSGTILQQPNVFIEAYYIFVDEYNKYTKEMYKVENGKNKR
jgi:hypothetical protein